MHERSGKTRRRYTTNKLQRIQLLGPLRDAARRYELLLDSGPHAISERLADTRTLRGVVVSNRLCCCNRMSIAFVATLLNDTEKISMAPYDIRCSSDVVRLRYALFFCGARWGPHTRIHCA